VREIMILVEFGADRQDMEGGMGDEEFRRRFGWKIMSSMVAVGC